MYKEGQCDYIIHVYQQKTFKMVGTNMTLLKS